MRVQSAITVKRSSWGDFFRPYLCHFNSTEPANADSQKWRFTLIFCRPVFFSSISFFIVLLPTHIPCKALQWLLAGTITVRRPCLYAILSPSCPLNAKQCILSRLNTCIFNIFTFRNPNTKPTSFPTILRRARSQMELKRLFAFWGDDTRVLKRHQKKSHASKNPLLQRNCLFRMLSWRFLAFFVLTSHFETSTGWHFPLSCLDSECTAMAVCGCNSSTQ